MTAIATLCTLALFPCAQDPSPAALDAKLHLVEQAEKAGPAGIPILLNFLSDEEVGSRAIRALGKMGPQATPAIPAIIKILRKYSGTTDDRAFAATEAIAQIGKPAIPALIKVLREDASCAEAVVALGDIGPAARDALPLLKEQFKTEKDLDTKHCIAKALVCIDRRQESAGRYFLDRLRKFDKAGNRNDAIAVAWFMAQNQVQGKEVVPLLARYLRQMDGHTGAREGLLILYSIWSYGAEGKAALPDLKTYVTKTPVTDLEEKDFQPLAAWILVKLDRAQLPEKWKKKLPEHIPSLIQELDTNFKIEMLLAADILGCLGKDAEKAILPLKTAITKCKDPQLKEAFQQALKKIETPRPVQKP